MAPEQWRGRLQDAKTDQYALAVTAYELIAGHVPFQGVDVGVLRECIPHETPEPIAGIPEHINAALFKALSKKREDRFPDCKSFIKAMAEKPKKPASWISTRTLVIGNVVSCVILLGLFAWIFSPPPKNNKGGDKVVKTASAKRVADDNPPVKTEEGGLSPAARNDAFIPAEQAEIDKFVAEFGKDVKAKDDKGNTLLHKAAKQGNVVVVKYLVSQGADVNVKGDDDAAVLFDAAWDNRVDMAKFFISQGVDVNARDDRGLTPLWMAASINRLEMVKFLVSQGADVHTKSNVRPVPQ